MVSEPNSETELGGGAALRGCHRPRHRATRWRHEDLLGQSARHADLILSTARLFLGDWIDASADLTVSVRGRMPDGQNLAQRRAGGTEHGRAHRRGSAVAKTRQPSAESFLTNESRLAPYFVRALREPGHRRDDCVARWHSRFERRQSGEKRRGVRLFAGRSCH